MKIYLICGEESGDIIGASIVKELKKLISNINIDITSPAQASSQNKQEIKLSFFGACGQNSQKEGVKSISDLSKISIIGLFEIAPLLSLFYVEQKKILKDILDKKPDLIITIDFPGFNIPLIKKLNRKYAEKNQNQPKKLQIVAPSMIISKNPTGKKYAKLFDALFTIFPFEIEYFTKCGLDTRFIGHPIFNQRFINKKKEKINAKKDLLINLFDDKFDDEFSGRFDSESKSYLCDEFNNRFKLIAITVGSRKSEIKRHAHIIAKTILITCNKVIEFNKHQKSQNTIFIRFLFIQHNLFYVELIKSILLKYDIYENEYLKIRFSFDKLKSYGGSDFVLSKIGTNNLEVANSNTAFLAFYRINFFSYIVARFIKNLNNLCLLNTIPIAMNMEQLKNRNKVPELFQFDCNPNFIYKTMCQYLSILDYSSNNLSNNFSNNSLNNDKKQKINLREAQIKRNREILDKTFDIKDNNSTSIGKKAAEYIYEIFITKNKNDR